MKPTKAVGVLLYNDNSILLVKHTEHAKLPTNAYGFPAGRVEENETIEEAAVRELREETGLVTTIDNLKKLPEKRNILTMKNGQEEFIFQPFLCTAFSGELIAAKETIPEFIPLDKLDDLFVITEDIKELSKQWFTQD